MEDNTVNVKGNGLGWPEENVQQKSMDMTAMVNNLQVISTVTPISPPPGIGWICFDDEEDEPEEFELLCVCTRNFRDSLLNVTSQELAIAVVLGNHPGSEPIYRRAGIAQVHQPKWFDSARKSSMILI